MSSQPATAPQVVITLSSPNDRQLIYAARHDVYALELNQHSTNAEHLLRDPLDERNEYIVAKQGDTLLGFVSVTPPGGGYSVDKYLSRDLIPVTFDESLFEIRLLTVVSAHRGRIIAPLLMYGALRYAESRGGSQLVAIGRREVVGMYARCGMEQTGLLVWSGAVEYELMTGTTSGVHQAIAPLDRGFERLRNTVDWQLPFPFREDTHCYHGGAFWGVLGVDFAGLDRSREIINADVLDAWFDPAPSVLAAIRENLPLLARTSPPTHAEGMVRAISRARGVPQGCILPAGGSSALIFVACQSWFTPRSRVLLLDPMYGEYRHVLETVIKCKVDSVIARAEDEFCFDLNELDERLKHGGYDAVALVNPNSPTGVLLPQDNVAGLISRYPAIRFWIDETYIEYCGSEHSVERVAAASRNAFVCKSMSKVYALSGLRAAYLVGPAVDVAALAQVVPPWAVSLPAQVAAIAALTEPDYYDHQYRTTATLRESLVAALRSRCKITTFPSRTNCLLCRLPSGAPHADEVVCRAREHNLFLRSGIGIHTSLGTDTIRIAVKGQAMNERAVSILRRVLPESTVN